MEPTSGKNVYRPMLQFVSVLGALQKKALHSFIVLIQFNSIQFYKKETLPSGFFPFFSYPERHSVYNTVLP